MGKHKTYKRVFVIVLDSLGVGRMADSDQFGDYEEAVFVGEADQFHKSFEFIQAHDIGPLNDRRLCSLYGIIEEYL